MIHIFNTPFELNYNMKTKGQDAPTNQTKVDSVKYSRISLKEFDIYAQTLIKLFGQYQHMKH